MQIEFVKLIYLGEGKNMRNNDIASELIQALNKAEADFGLSDILQAQGRSKDESVRVEFKYGDESLPTCQRDIDSSNERCCWSQSNEQCVESLEKRQPSRFVGKEIAEVLNKADMLSTFKNVLQKHNMIVSEEKPVMVQFAFSDGFGTVFKCPCPGSPRRCCEVVV